MLLLAAPKGSAAAVAAVAATAMVSDETKEWLSEHKKPLIGAAVLAALVVALLLYIFVFRKWWGTSSAANVGATTTAMGKTSGGSLGKLVAATEAGTGSEPTTYKVTMKTAHGKFVTLTPTGTVEANRSVAASDWEHVTIVVAGPPYAAGGNATLVALKSSSGKWVGMSGGSRRPGLHRAPTSFSCYSSWAAPSTRCPAMRAGCSCQPGPPTNSISCRPNEKSQSRGNSLN